LKRVVFVRQFSVNVLARVSDKFDYEMHLDTDEANAAGLKNDDYLKIIPNR